MPCQLWHSSFQLARMSTPSEWYGTLPLITKVWLTCAVVTGLIVRFEYMPPTVFLVDWNAIFKHWQVRSFM